LKNVDWERGFRRLWAVYAIACLVISAFFAFLSEYFDGQGFWTFIGDFLGTFANNLSAAFFFIIIPVIVSKAIQWVIKGFQKPV
jgi:hypothetical protein